MEISVAAVPLQKNPEPALQGANHAGERAIDSLLALQPFVVRKERKLLQMLITLLQLEFISDRGIPPSRVDNIERTNVFGGTCFCTSEDAQNRVPPHEKRRAILIKIDVLDHGLLANFR